MSLAELAHKRHTSPRQCTVAMSASSRSGRDPKKGLTLSTSVEEFRDLWKCDIQRKLSCIVNIVRHAFDDIAKDIGVIMAHDFRICWGTNRPFTF